MTNAAGRQANLRQTKLNRRHLLQAAVAHSIGIPLIGSLATRSAFGQVDLEPMNRFPRMVQEWFVSQVREIQQQRHEQLDKLKTRADAEAYVKSVQERIRMSFGSEPARTPLNPRITGVLERDGYRVEKVIFDSRPDFPVTANLYLPTDSEKPVPGVVGTCGHSSNGKAAEAYQSFAQGLARLGYVCLIYDPIGQGERLQYTDQNLKPRFGSGVSEHLIAGNQQYLVGEFFGMWRAWDGIRALDYLLTRPEVDKNHLGVTGNSGGGTMTTWLCGVEPRWTMAAPACFVTTILRNLENELPQDTEQCPPKVLALGLDHADFLAAQAPDPIVILAKERDYFDARGAEQAYQDLKHLYGLLGAEENVSQFIGPTTHGFTQENRSAMYRWFNHVTKISDADREPTIVLEKDEDLWCTPHGQVAELKPRTVFSFTAEKSRKLGELRGEVSGDDLQTAITDVLKLPARQGIADYRILRYLNNRQYPLKYAITYAIESEPGIQALVYRLFDERWYSRPPQGPKRALLYVAHTSSDAELRDEPLIHEILQQEPDAPLYTCDVRGIGESMPDTCDIDSFHKAYGCDFFYAAQSLMLDRPYLGQKVHDVLRVVDWMQSLGHSDIHLIGLGWGALAGALAAVLHEGVGQITLKHALRSYSDVAQSEQYAWPLAQLPPDVLARFDLPDCYREVKSKKLRLIEPWDAMAK